MKKNIEIEERAIRALKRTWQRIGYDILACFGDAEQVTLDASDVREAVTTCGFATGYPMDHGDDPEAVEWLGSQSEARQERILREAFPRGNYGA